MKNVAKCFGIVALAALIGFGVMACGGTDEARILLVIPEGQSFVFKGDAKAFTAELDGKDSTDVVWSVAQGEAATGNTPMDARTGISSDGVLEVSVGETSVSLVITATLKSDENVSGSTTVTVAAAPAGVIVVSPADPVVPKGGSITLRAFIDGELEKFVTWEIATPTVAEGTLIGETSGQLVVDAAETATSFEVTVTNGDSGAAAPLDEYTLTVLVK